MKKTIYTIMISVIMLLAGQITQVNAQCVDFTANMGLAWTDLNTAFGGAPCDDGTGCQFMELTAFEIFASEAYVLNGFVAGGEYSFSACNGAGGNAWVIDFTIVAPSGAIDAFGAGDGDGCTISWTASEDGQYTIIINEEDNCGGGPNIATSNGFPAVNCLSGTPCAAPEPCSAGVLTTAGEIDICNANELFTIEVEGEAIPTGGNLLLSSIPLTGASGANNGNAFDVGLPVGANPISLNWDLNGFLAQNGSAPYMGPWAFIVSTQDAAGTVCSQTADTLFVNFGPDGASCDPASNICDAGTLQTVGEVSICDAAGTFEITATNDTIPTGGNYGFSASNILGGTGGTGGVLNFLSGTNTINYDSDLNGFLSTGLMAPPLSGTWVFRGLVADAANNICAITTDSLIVSFGTESPSIVDFTTNGIDDLTVTATGGVMPYSYLWDDPAAQTTQTAVGLEPGIGYSVTIVDANGCIVDGESPFSVNTNTISSLSDYSISPNPSNGSFIVDLNFEENSLIEIDIMDITGKVIREASQTASSTTFNFNLQNVPAGMYFINIAVGHESMTQRIVISK